MTIRTFMGKLKFKHIAIMIVNDNNDAEHRVLALKHDIYDLDPEITKFKITGISFAESGRLKLHTDETTESGPYKHPLFSEVLDLIHDNVEVVIKKNMLEPDKIVAYFMVGEKLLYIR